MSHVIYHEGLFNAREPDERGPLGLGSADFSPHWGSQALACFSLDNYFSKY
jgi:hypothetical protein